VPIKARTVAEAGFPALLSANAYHRSICSILDNILLRRFVFPPWFRKLGPYVTGISIIFR
jgi:hypothetical protein